MLPFLNVMLLLPRRNSRSMSPPAIVLPFRSNVRLACRGLRVSFTSTVFSVEMSVIVLPDAAARTASASVAYAVSPTAATNEPGLVS